MKKLILGASFLFALVVTGVSSFFVGYQREKLAILANLPTPTPTPSETIAPLVEPTPSALPTETPQTGTPSPNSDFKTLVIPANRILDGFESNNGAGNLDVDIRAGRNTYLTTRGFVSFDIKELPKNAHIENATLRLFQTNITGSPYTAGGNLKIDHLDYGSTLENEDYLLPSLTTDLATLSTSDPIEWKEATVTEAIKDDIKNFRPRSQYRIRFTIEKIGKTAGGDFAYFESAENYSGSGNTPQLVVRYSL